MKGQVKKVLIPVDFSLASKNAIRYVKNVFDGEPIQVILLYVTNEGWDDIQEIEDGFTQIRKLELGGSSFLITHTIIHGDPATEIMKSAKNGKTDLVILGLKGDSELLSIADELLKNIESPIITVPENYVSHKVKRITYASDHKQVEYSEVFDIIRLLAQKFDSKVYIFHLYPEQEMIAADQSEPVLEYYLESTRHEYFTVADPNILEAIHDFVERQHIDLLAVLARDHGHNELHSEGKLVYELARVSQVPMLILN